MNVTTVSAPAANPKNSQLILYLDLDGVLVDFDDGYKKLSGGFGIRHYVQQVGEPTARDTFLKAGSDFWENLNWIHGGKALWEAANSLFENVNILSSAGTTDAQKANVVASGKRKWLKKHLPELNDDHIFIVPGKHRKKEFASRDSILVDDIAITIQEWNSNGGFGILHNSATYKKTINELKTISSPISLAELVNQIKK